jgi:hypothetical protein
LQIEDCRLQICIQSPICNLQSAIHKMYPHRIRLRGPWEYEPLAPEQEGSARASSRRVNMPCRFSDLGLEHGVRRVLLRRRFGYPGRIDAHERIWLTFADIAGNAELRLNGQALGHVDPGAFEIEVTSLLRDRNVLEVCLELSNPDTNLWDEMALEIRCSAFLQGVTARRDGGRLLVRGEVVGTCARPLDLYLLINGVNADHQMIEAGKAFQFVTDQPVTPASIIRVELVDAASVWHTVELLESEG